MKTLDYTNKALKQIEKLPNETLKETIVKAINTLANWPDCRNIKSLTNKEGYRLRVGSYRVKFEVRGNLILVTEVKKRNERTYN